MSHGNSFWELCMDVFPFIIPAIVIGFAGTYMLGIEFSLSAVLLLGLFWVSLLFVYVGCQKIRELR